MIGKKQYRGQGLAKEALLFGIEFMVKERNIHRFQAKILESNFASLKMYQKCGYVIEGLMRNAIYKKWEISESICYSPISLMH